MQAYSNPKRENNPHSLPDVEIFELTAIEAAEQQEELLWVYSKKPEYKLASMNSKIREKMLQAIVDEECIEGGWFWWSCFPGCMPDGPAIGPFKTAKEALEDAQSNSDDDDGEENESN
jgi:hypothetical protein